MAQPEVRVSNSRRNTGMALDFDWIEAQIAGQNDESGGASILAPPQKTGLEKLILAVSLLDLTRLKDDDTEDEIVRFCARAKQPVNVETLRSLKVWSEPKVAAVCVFFHWVESAVRALENAGIPVAAAAGDFPQGQAPLKQRLDEIYAALNVGAEEIDAVINRKHVRSGQWQEIYDDVCSIREACGEKRLKMILATGELESSQQIARASLICMMAGADFIKTSTGREAVNAKFPAGRTIMRSIGDYFRQTGFCVGFKPAGGIQTADQAFEWMALVQHELGEPWMNANFFRIGASTLLSDIELRLTQLAQGAHSTA